MPNVRTLGAAGATIDLLDTTKYRVPRESETENKMVEVVWNPVRNTATLNVGNVDHTATELAMDVWVTGADWQTVLDNYAAIQTRLDAARDFSIFGTGTVVAYVEQAGNQSSPTTYTVKYGTLREDRRRRSAETLTMVGHLTLLCEPR
jgi:hypothetical protein